MLSQIEVTDDLAIKIGRKAVHLSPSEGFRLAQRLIRKSTSKMVADELAAFTDPDSRANREVLS